MSAPSDDLISSLRLLAADVSDGTYSPFSKRHEAAVVLLSDGSWIPGVRVESASYSLTIAPVANALSTAAAVVRRDVAAIVTCYGTRPEDEAFLVDTFAGAFSAHADGVYVNDASPLPSAPTSRLSPFEPEEKLPSSREGIALARRIADRAYTPESSFPVGCVLQLSTGQLLAGVNVEHGDWTRILCAERNALGTALSYRLSGFKALYLSCPSDPLGSPCGACRQLLAEISPGATLWMDRGSNPPAASTPGHLLPGYFSGQTLHQVQ